MRFTSAIKKICACLIFLLLGLAQTMSANEEVLVFHYPLYYFSPDKSVNLSNVQALAAGIENLLVKRFETVPTKQRGTAKVSGVTYFGEIEDGSLSTVFEQKYPAIIIAEAESAGTVLGNIKETQKVPMVLVFLNVPKVEEGDIPSNIPKVINIFGLEQPEHFQLSEDENVISTLGLREAKVDLFETPT